ncbi:acyl-CoA carboxylase epsilon subunit [Sinomonas sp. JGH33]|uniref:Acyl-CoA carboxylase epsilon subunit n=1 Tax=Sinomonas terricola TaxID=3110330 RepID=A0ABU5TC01_9MICC|nr:acyl-CoA carboxylase epsilon subunit [Sinomonas sp. JGH33]MEA5456621.1 acyl-CoA carboxylase epsilon subunit [Sinomonas sp. JGH33]
MSDATPAAPGAANDDGEVPAVEPSPLFAVTKGNPTPEELAAVTAVLAAVGSSEEAEEAPAALTRRERIRRAALRPRNMMSQRRGRF